MIHFIWIGDATKNKYQDTPELWHKLGYDVKEWDERSILDLAASNGMNSYCNILKSLDSNIKKSDLARLLVVTIIGGTYMDYDIQPHSGKLPLKLCKSLSLVLEHATGLNGMPLVANGIIVTKTLYHPFLMSFLRKYAYNTSNPVLEYLGPHALTKHLNSWRDNHEIRLMSPQVMLWEDQHGAPPDYVVARHRNACSWGGDRSKSGWDSVLCD